MMTQSSSSRNNSNCLPTSSSARIREDDQGSTRQTTGTSSSNNKNNTATATAPQEQQQQQQPMLPVRVPQDVSSSSEDDEAPPQRQQQPPQTLENTVIDPAHRHEIARNPTIAAYGRNAKPLTKKWPSELMRLMNVHNDNDEWLPVLQRLTAHPDEICVIGQNGGQNALHAACVRYPPVHIVTAMIQARPQAAAVQNFSGETALHLASYSASEPVQAVLIQAHPAAARLQDQYGDTPLHFAARAGATYPLQELLLQAAPASLQVPNDRGVTPFWLLPRSFLQATSLQEIVGNTTNGGVAGAGEVEEGGGAGDNDDEVMSEASDSEEEDEYDSEEDDDDDDEDARATYADDWNLTVLFLRYAYFDQTQVANSPRADTYCEHANYDWLVAAAASTPACPREVLRFLCRLFPDQALRYDDKGCTPLLLACQAAEMAEPADWDENEDGFREPVEVADDDVLPINNEGDHVLAPEEQAVEGGDAAFIHQVVESSSSEQQRRRQQQQEEDDEENEQPSVIEILLEWSPRSAFLPDQVTGRLPLAHALAAGKSWNVIRHVIAACPKALEAVDPVTHMPMFLLAAQHAPQLDTVYTICRSLPSTLLLSSSSSTAAAANRTMTTSTTAATAPASSSGNLHQQPQQPQPRDDDDDDSTSRPRKRVRRTEEQKSQ